MALTNDTVLDIDKDRDDGEELKFQDFGDSNIEADADGQTHTFNNYPSDNEDEEDNTELLTGRKKSHSFWTFEYYQSFFDVETYQVLRRLLASFVPKPGKSTISDIRPNPDLYVSIAATAVFCYWWLIASILWGMLSWRRSQAGYTYLEIICVYGYSLAIYIPVSFLYVIPVAWVQWVLMCLALLLSGAVLLLTFWPAVKDDDKKFAIGILAGIFIFHALLAVGFKFYFFKAPEFQHPSIPATHPAVIPSHSKQLQGQAHATEPNFAPPGMPIDQHNDQTPVKIPSNIGPGLPDSAKLVQPVKPVNVQPNNVQQSANLPPVQPVGMQPAKTVVAKPVQHIQENIQLNDSQQLAEGI
ncbi:protein YIPF1-like [Saccoglossus kowalevskii]|uniref:Protein YIPF1-like n=1 Tax=Saccoglossus kowalevskii TaxID=10224 RepID=A0ABM0N025_SACKO|nr:PREDICTED: protein YIPF1-like [Saccoglossus kowalevskii]